MVTVAVSLPSALVAVYVKLSEPVKPVGGVYSKLPSALRVTVPPWAVESPAIGVAAGAGKPVSLLRTPGAEMFSTEFFITL